MRVNVKMSAVISCIIQYTVSIIMNVLIFLFFYKIYSSKYRSKALYIGIFILWTGCLIGVNQLKLPPANLLYTVVFSNLICVKLFDITLKKSWLYNCLLLLIMFFSDSATIFIWTAVKGKNLQSIISNDQLMAVSNLMNILVMFLGYKIYTAVLDRNSVRAIKIHEAVFLFLMTLFESYIIYNLMWKVENLHDGIVIITVLIGFLFFNIYVTYIIQQIAEAYRYKYELSMAKRQNEIQLAHYKEIECQYKESRCVIHDIKKHISILSELKNTDNPKASEYGTLIENEVDSLFSGFHCSNQILSIVMSQKIAAAEKNKIKVKTRVEDLPLDFMNDLDITAIFANLWDNAIEACEKVDPEKRFVDLELKKVNGFVLINVQNSFDNNLKKRKNKIMSTKENHIGVGLSIIDRTIKKYDGLFVTETNDGLFKSEITIPIPIAQVEK